MNKSNAAIPFEAIYRDIRTRICLLTYEPGAMLSENALATEYGVSRTPIRRILQRLEFEGLVTTKQGVGTLVTTIDIRQLKEVYALRIKLAELIGDLSSPPPADADFSLLDELSARCDAMRNEQDYGALGQLNLDFNDFLISFISNKPLQEISNRLYYQTARVWPQILPDLDWEEEVDYMGTEIKQIAEALRRGDMRQVGQIRRDQIAMSLTRIQRYLGEVTVR